MRLLNPIFTLIFVLTTSLPAAPVGIFEESADVGTITLKGSSAFLPDKNQYRISGSGKNIWFMEDAFHFLSKKVSGDLVFTMDAGWDGGGKEPHRKACAMVRATLDPDSPYVDVAVHGDGLIELQYRTAKGATTLAARTPIQAPATVQLERDGDVFTASVSKAGGPFQPIGAVSVAMPDPLYTGIAVSAHNAANLETALVSNVSLTNRIAKADEKRIRESTLEILDIETAERKIVYRDNTPFEAPNWSRDGKLFYLNRQGLIWTLPVNGGELTQLNTGAVIKNNNDHGLSTDGKWLALSAGSGENGSKIFIVPATGGEPRQITPLGPSYWHGWCPDDQTLIYCAKRDNNFDVYAIPAAGGPEVRLTDAPGLDDGCEYTPDGRRIFFHSERTGPAKIWRMNPDGTAQEQVTFDEQFADWFPHPSPDGKWLSFVCFDKSVKGHPFNQNVVIRLMPAAGGKPKVIATLFGGQGSINVPSWSPDSKKLAFVSYRHRLPLP
jgi:TolB protein